jgi:hypothetical protein
MTSSPAEPGKHVDVFVHLGTVPEAVTASAAALAQYTRDAFHVELVDAAVQSVTFSSNARKQQQRSGGGVAVVAAGIQLQDALPAAPDRARGIVEQSKAVAAARAAAEEHAHLLQPQQSSSGTSPKRSQSPTRQQQQRSLDSLASIAGVVALCHQQARQIALLETALAESKAAAEDAGPRSALVAERGRSLLLSAELEDVKDRLRASEATVEKFAAIIAKLKDDVRQLVEMHSIGDFQGSL